MSPYKISLWLCAALFFTGGILWGLKGAPFYRIGSPQTISLICKEDWISNEALKHVEEKLNVHIERVSFENWSEYSRLLANHQGQFDLLCAHSFLARDLSSFKWLDHFDYKTLEGYKGISAEFRSLPFDPEEKHFLPLGWLLNGYAFSKDSKLDPNWKEIWPAHGKKLSMNFPSLELYIRMKEEGMEIDPEKQGRYNRDPEAKVSGFLKKLGSIHEPTKRLSPEDFKEREIFQVTHAQALDLRKDSYADFKVLEDGNALWFLLMGVGSQSANKALAREVMNEFLSPTSSNLLRIKNGFAHVLAHFNDRTDVPAPMKASFIRQFPLRNIQFPELTLEGLPQWETFMTRNLENTKQLKKD